MHHLRLKCYIVALGALVASTTVQAQVWTPIVPAAERTQEFTSGGTFPIPKSIAAKGGVLRLLLVAGGSGGHSPAGSCNDSTVQGGQGGDGGEVFEAELPLLPGQCQAGLQIQVGAGGRGALRLGNGPIGEPGGDTQILCEGVPVARALGGAKRVDIGTAVRSAKGGVGGAIMNGAEAVNNAAFDQRVISTHPAQAGQVGYLGYGSGGGGGGASMKTTATTVRADGTAQRAPITRIAPRGRGSHGAGNGAGADDFQTLNSGGPAENAAMYGAGGGGGALNCAASGYLDAGHGYSGMARIRWRE